MGIPDLDFLDGIMFESLGDSRMRSPGRIGNGEDAVGSDDG